MERGVTVAAESAIIDCMASITIRNLDEATKKRLRLRAARRNHSMEEEARAILREAVREDAEGAGNLADAIGRRFRALGGVELVVPARSSERPPPSFG